MYPLLKILHPGLELKKQKHRQQLLQHLARVSTSSAVFVPSERESQKPGVAATVALPHTNVAATKTFSNKLLLSVDLCVCVVVLVCLQLYLYFCIMCTWRYIVVYLYFFAKNNKKVVRLSPKLLAPKLLRGSRARQKA